LTLSPITSTGAFSDPNLPAGFAPFNVQRFGRKLYVTYAMQDNSRHDDVAGSGNGLINIFDFSGNLDTCIALRTAYIAGGTFHIQAGGGIVADSEPSKEYWESVNKAKALLTAAQIAERLR